MAPGAQGTARKRRRQIEDDSDSSSDDSSDDEVDAETLKEQAKKKAVSYEPDPYAKKVKKEKKASEAAGPDGDADEQAPTDTTSEPAPQPTEKKPKVPLTKKQKKAKHAKQKVKRLRATEVKRAAQGLNASAEEAAEEAGQAVSKAPVEAATSNLEEAEAMRARLGITPADPKSAATKSAFSFGFADLPTPGDGPSDDDAADEAAADEAAADEAAADAAALDAASRPADAGPEDVSLPPPPPGAAVAAGGGYGAAGGGSWGVAARAPPPPQVVDAEGYVERRVYVGGMPFWYGEEEIRECWGACGEIEDLTMMTFPDSGRFKGLAFLTFSAKESFESALAYNGETLEGGYLTVKRCQAARPRTYERPVLPPAPAGVVPASAISATRAAPVAAAAAAAGEGAGEAGGDAAVEAAPEAAPKVKRHGEDPPQKVVGYNVAFVGNVPWELNKQAVEDLFEGMNPKFVRMFDDPATQKHRGFAHVHFHDEDGLDKAIALNGMALMGRTIKVMYAQPSAKHQELQKKNLDAATAGKGGKRPRGKADGKAGPGKARRSNTTKTPGTAATAAATVDAAAAPEATAPAAAAGDDDAPAQGAATAGEGGPDGQAADAGAAGGESTGADAAPAGEAATAEPENSRVSGKKKRWSDAKKALRKPVEAPKLQPAPRAMPRVKTPAEAPSTAPSTAAQQPAAQLAPAAGAAPAQAQAAAPASVPRAEQPTPRAEPVRAAALPVQAALPAAVPAQARVPAATVPEYVPPVRPVYQQPAAGSKKQGKKQRWSSAQKEERKQVAA